MCASACDGSDSRVPSGYARYDVLISDVIFWHPYTPD